MPPPIISSGFEKHAQTAIQIILVAITIWVGTAILTLRDSSIRLEENHKHLVQALSDIRGEVAALRSIAVTQAEQRLEVLHRIVTLENRVENLERRFNARKGNQND